MMARAVDLMLDSGAFTMWNRGLSLDVRDYIAWLKDHHRLFYSYVSLDVIPGKYGRKLQQNEVIESAEGSYKNQQLMKENGLTPIPVFHQGEPFAFLERYLRDLEPYIGIATMKSTPIEDQTKWLDQTFTALTTSKGEPIVKLHGFGITRPKLVMRYPWFTTDSTTWTLTPSFGQLWVPVMHQGGKPDYSLPPMQVVISDVERAQTTNSRKVDSFNQTTMRALEAWLFYCGITLEEARYDPNKRRWAMLVWFTEFQQSWRVQPFRIRGASFLGTEFKNPPKIWKPTGRLHIHLATNLSKQWAEMMNDIGARFRLLNYHEMRDRPSQELERYIQNGTTGKHKASELRPDWRARYTSERRLMLVKRVEDYCGFSED